MHRNWRGSDTWLRNLHAFVREDYVLTVFVQQFGNPVTQDLVCLRLSFQRGSLFYAWHLSIFFFHVFLFCASKATKTFRSFDFRLRGRYSRGATETFVFGSMPDLSFQILAHGDGGSDRSATFKKIFDLRLKVIQFWRRTLIR